MKSFAIQWLEPMFEFNQLVFLIILLLSLICGLIIFLSTKIWVIGAYTAASIFLSTVIFLGKSVFLICSYYLCEILNYYLHIFFV